MKHAICIEYELMVSKTTFEGFSDQARQILERLAVRPSKQRISVLLSDQEIVWGYGDKSEVILRLNLDSGSRLLIDHRRKEYLSLDQGPESSKLAPFGGRMPTVRRIGNCREFQAGELRTSNELFQVYTQELSVDAWISPNVIAPAKAIRALVNLLIPGAPEETSNLGLPTELLMRDYKSPEANAFHVKLVDFRRVAEKVEPFAPPAGYRNTAPDRAPRSVKTAKKNKVLAPAALDRASISLAEALRLGLQRKDLGANLAGALVGGDDFALLTDQPFLEQTQNALNALGCVFGKFSGDGDGGNETMHVRVDWWNQLRPHFNFSDNDAVVDSLKQLWLAYKVMQGKPLVGIPYSEQIYPPSEYQTYVQIARGEIVDPDIRAVLGLEVARYFTFLDAFSRSRVAELEETEFNDLTKELRLDFGIKDYKKKNVLGLLDFRTWDFDTDIAIDGTNVIQALKHDTDHIKLVIYLKQFYVDFQFSTTPSGSALSIILAILSLGGTALLSTNYGWGYFNIDDAQIAIDITSSQVGDTTELQATVDSDASDMDSSAFVFGVNLVQDVLDALVTVVVSFANSLNPTILEQIRRPIADLIKGLPFQWPEIWAATGGPGVTTGGVADALRAIKGKLASPLPDIPESFTKADYARVSPLGYAVSRQYLTGWVRSIIGGYPEERIADADWQGKFGVALPDISTFPIPPDIEAQLGPFEGEVDRYYRTRIVRRAPVVGFPQSGQVSYAGQLEAWCEVYLEAVVKIAHPETVTTPERTRCYDISGVPGLEPPEMIPGVGEALEIEPPGFGPLPPPEHWKAPGRRMPKIDMGSNPRGYFFLGLGVPNLSQGGKGMICVHEPPEMHVTTTYSLHSLSTLVKARFRATGNLLLGFNRQGNPWLPEIRISLEESNGAPILQPDVPEVETADSFDGVDRDQLRKFVQGLCFQDVQKLLTRVTFAALDAPASVRRLVPEAAVFLGAPQDLLDMVIYRQRGSGDPPALSYLIEGSLLYWPFDIVENLSSHLS